MSAEERGSTSGHIVYVVEASSADGPPTAVFSTRDAALRWVRDDGGRCTITGIVVDWLLA